MRDVKSGLQVRDVKSGQNVCLDYIELNLQQGLWKEYFC